MKLICEKNKLTEAVSKVQIATVSSSLPALEGIFFDCKDGYLTLTGYNLEMGVTAAVEAKAEQDGQIIMSAKYFSEIVRKIPGNTVSIETDDKYICTIKSGETKFSIIGMPPEEYPDVPTVTGGDGFEIEGNLLAGMIRQTRFAVAKKEDKPIYNGICFSLGGGEITLVALDGYRLAIVERPITAVKDIRIIVPSKTMTEVSHLLANDDEEDVHISANRRYVVFTTAGYTIMSRLIEGEFLNYRNVIPAGSRTRVTIDTKDFISTIERASLIITERLKNPLRISFTEGKVVVRCQTNLGRVVDEFSAACEGDEVEIGFNNRYLLDALRNARTEQVRMEISGPLSPVKVLPVEGNDFLYLVLPVRFKND